MQIVGGWLQEARICKSPNQNERPEGDSVALLVVHNISLPPGKFGGGYIEQFFQNKLDISADRYFEEIQQLTVSAHVLIERNGNIVQFVSFDKRAWHAGISEYAGRESCNDFSVGVELEGTDELPYTKMQYQALASLHKALQAYYPGLVAEAVTGHSDIAPGRKTDPGRSFNWSYFRSL